MLRRGVARFGPGGRVRIFNGTGYDFVRTAASSYQMDWAPPKTIAKGTYADMYMEFRTTIFTNAGDDSANAKYTLAGSDGNQGFELQASFRRLDVKYVTLPESPKFRMCPPPPSRARGGSVNVGWKHDGLTSLAIFQGKRDFGVMPASAGFSNWMEYFRPIVGNMPITNMVLVESHDAGTSKLVSPVAGPWAKTQNLSLKAQLEAGVRMLDLRVGKNGSAFCLTHAGWNTNYDIDTVVKEVLNFLKRYTQEVVILDMHQFESSTPLTLKDKKQVAKRFKDGLGTNLYCGSDANPTLNSLIEGGKRVILCWNDSESDPKVSAIGPVKQGWFPDAKSADQLKSMIRQALPYPKGSFRTVGAVIPAGAQSLISAVPVIPEVGDWFVPGSDLNAKRPTVVQTDFVEQTGIIQSCVAECANRGMRN